MSYDLLVGVYEKYWLNPRVNNLVVDSDFTANSTNLYGFQFDKSGIEVFGENVGVNFACPANYISVDMVFVSPLSSSNANGFSLVSSPSGPNFYNYISVDNTLNTNYDIFMTFEFLTDTGDNFRAAIIKTNGPGNTIIDGTEMLHAIGPGNSKRFVLYAPNIVLAQNDRISFAVKRELGGAANVQIKNIYISVGRTT